MCPNTVVILYHATQCQLNAITLPIPLQPSVAKTNLENVSANEATPVLYVGLYTMVLCVATLRVFSANEATSVLHVGLQLMVVCITTS